jgi:DNA topoisomerase I
MARLGGWRRRGRAPRFRYEDAHGNAIEDDERLDRIRSLVIPPAWRDVWISPNPRAKLQATGVDSAGRTQYLYHSAFREAQEQAKFDRLVRFGELLPGLREQIRRDLRQGPYELCWASGVAVTLINRAWFRVGSERHARSARTYGVTTLYKSHVDVRGDRLRFCFRTKNGALVRTTLVDPRLAEAVKELLALPGGARLFRFERAGELANLTGPLLNAYIAENLGDDFTAKDFRTWGGTLTAAVALAEHGPPESEPEAKRVLSSVMRRVGDELGNTAAVARASYVSPAVVEQYLEGVTLERFEANGRRPLSALQRGLSRDERALLSLLRSWRARRARTPVKSSA